MKVRFIIKEQEAPTSEADLQTELDNAVNNAMANLDTAPDKVAAQAAITQALNLLNSIGTPDAGPIEEKREKMTKKANLPAKLKRFVDRKQDQIRKFVKEKGKSSDQITKFVSMMRDIAESSYDRYYGDGKRFEKMDDFMSYVARTINDKMPTWALKGKPTKFHGPGKSGPIKGSKK
jgi:hypothetical protein